MSMSRSVPFFYSPEAGEMVSYSEMMQQTQVVEEAPETLTEQATEQAVETTNEVETLTENVATETAKVTQAAPVQDWRELVSPEDLMSEATKRVDRNAFLKAAGIPENLMPLVGKIDEETIKFLEFKAAGGNAHEYLRIKNTDYAQLSAVQLLEMEIKEKYPKIDSKTFGIVLKKELSKYNLDREEFPDESDEAAIGEFMLKEDTDKIRAKYIDKQDSLKAPEPKPDTSAQDRAIVQQQVTDTVRNSGTVKELQTNKNLTFGEGDEAFNFEVKNVDQIVNAVMSAALQNGQTPTEADVKDMVSTFAIHADKKAFIQSLISYGKTLGEKSVSKELRNVQPGTSTTNSQTGYKSAAEALAKDGRMVSHAEATRLGLR